MARRFKDRAQQALYEQYLATPPSHKGGSRNDAYFLGLEHPHRPPCYGRTSLAYAAWAAGVETTRQTEEGRT